MSSRDTSAFGLLCVTLGFLTRDQVGDLLEEQLLLRSKGVRKRIGELCIEKKWMTKEQFLVILRAQGKQIMSCRRCQKSYNIHARPEGEPIRCKHCDDTLVEPSQRLDPRVFDTALLSSSETAVNLIPPERRVSPDMDERIRTLLPGYEVLQVLGRGGMGVVYKAWDEILKRFVAVKLLAADLAQDQEYIDRFNREASMAGKLRHPNIVEAYDCGEAGAERFFLMEYVDGEPLDKVMRKRRGLPEHEAMDIIRQVAEALEYAWKQKIIHRDIKPQNLLVTKDGTVKVCDLGLSRDIASDTSLTIAGHINCSPAYASPEQGRGVRDLDARSDIYSLGVSLYEMLTAKPPFQGEGPGDLILKHSLEPRPDPAKSVLTLSVNASNLTMRMMAIQRDDRPWPGEVARMAREILSMSDTIVSRLP